MCFWQQIFVYRLINRGEETPLHTFSVPELFPRPSLFQSRQLCWPCSAYLKLRGIFYNIYIYLTTHPALQSPPHFPPPPPSYSPNIRLPRYHTAGLLDVLDNISVLLREACDILTDIFVLLRLSTLSHVLLSN